MNSNDGRPSAFQDPPLQALRPLPAGVASFHGAEVRARRAIERAVRGVFEPRGYDEIVPPLFDDASTFDRTLASKLYTFMGRDGRLLALRPDFTSLVARIVATRMRADAGPFRLFYSGEVVRYETPQAGRVGEFHQIGLEFVGGSGTDADSEILRLASEALAALGLADGVIAVGHAGVVRTALAQLGVDERVRAEARRLLARRDPSALSRLLGDASIARDRAAGFVALAADNGVRQSVGAAREALGRPCEAALDELERTLTSVRLARPAARIALDLSESRGLDYYTGVVFRIYAPGLGADVGGGGRYDDLLASFGRPMPAVGFMLSVDRLAQLRMSAAA